MTSVTATASQFEMQVLETELVAAKFRAAIHGAHVYARALYFGRRAATLLKNFVGRLHAANNSGLFDDMPAAEFVAFADDLTKLYSGVSRALDLARGVGLHEKPLHRGVFVRIQAQTERLGEIIEAFRLSSNPQFNTLVEEAVGPLKSAAR